MAEPTRTIVIVAFDGATLMDVVSPAEVFEIAARYVARPAAYYDVKIVSQHGGPVTGWSGLSIATRPWAELNDQPIDTIIVTGGAPPHDPPSPQPVVEWLAGNAHRARRVCGICTGTFIMAAAGLIDGKRATTHWQSTDLLQSRYDAARVEADPIYVRDGAIWTSAGFTAGIDVALALIEDDEGHAIAMEVARMLVVFLKRPGGQSQLSGSLSAQLAFDHDFSKLHGWIADHLDEDLRIERLAERAGMAPRTFERNYVARLGRPPAKTVTSLRVEAACQMILSADLSLKDIARKTGFVTEQNLRRSFQRLKGITPQQYRAGEMAPAASGISEPHRAT